MTGMALEARACGENVLDSNHGSSSVPPQLEMEKAFVR
jgi:hypothetical protein